MQVDLRTLISQSAYLEDESQEVDKRRRSVNNRLLMSIMAENKLHLAWSGIVPVGWSQK